MNEFKISITPPQEDEVPKVNNNYEIKVSDEMTFESIENELLNDFNSKGIYFRELGKLNRFINLNYKRLKDLIEEIHQIRKNNFELKNQINTIDNDIMSQIDNQKSILSLLENSEKKIFEEKKSDLKNIINKISKLKKNKEELIQKKKENEEIMFNKETDQITLLKEKKNSIDSTLENFSLLKTKTLPIYNNLIDSSKNNALSEIEQLKKELEELTSSSNKTEETKNKLKLELNNKLQEANSQQDKLLIECEQLRVALNEKMQQTIILNNKINEYTSSVKLIDKYGEKYKEIYEKEELIKEKEIKTKKESEELKDILERIDIFNKKYDEMSDFLNENIAIMENFINIAVVQKEQIECYNNEINNLKISLENNEEKIEILELENKSLEAEISPVQLKISKLENEKKFNINKMKFEYLTEIFNNIEKLKNEKNVLNEKIKEVNDQIFIFQNENMKILKEIDNKTKLYVDIEGELKSENIHYIKSYENILNDLPENLKNNNNTVVDEIKLLNDEIEQLNDDFNDSTALLNQKKNKTNTHSKISKIIPIDLN